MNNPFDFMKMFPQYDPQEMMRQMQNAFGSYQKPSAPQFDMSALSEAQNKNMKALTEANGKAIEYAQKLMGYQAQLLQQAMTDATEAGKTLAGVQNPTELAERQSELMQAAVEKALASSTEISHLVAEAQESLTQVVSERFEEGMKEIKDVVKG